GAALLLLAATTLARLRRAPLLLALVLAACSPTPVQLTAPVARGGDTEVSARVEAERQWAGRLAQHKLPAAPPPWKRAVATDDGDAESWVMLARASYFLGDGFLDPAHAPDDEVLQTFEEGAAFADRGLRALSPIYEARRRAGLEVDEAAADLGAE